MENPFESGHIKNYILLYVSVVVIMVLFFIAATLFNDVQKIKKKIFDTNLVENSELKSEKAKEKEVRKFKLMDRVY